jgi:nucleoside-diphosphate-sugar epimerase
MKVIVSGGAGYIGSVTTEMLCDEGHEVVVFPIWSADTNPQSILAQNTSRVTFA